MKKYSWKRIALTTAWMGAGIGFMILLMASSNDQYSLHLQEDVTIQIDYEKGLQFVRVDEVQTLLSVWFEQDITGYTIQSANLSGLESRLEEIPYVKNAEVFVDIHGNLSVWVEQRQPVLRVINRNGVSYYIDEGGEKIPLTANFTARVPVLTGFFVDNGVDYGQLEGEEIIQLFALSEYIRHDVFLSALIDQIHITQQHEVELIPRIGRHTILLGEPLDWEQKLWKLQPFYQSGMQQAGWKSYRTIDLRFNNQIVCKR
jgi:cell division protein FtsQ